ncbi:MULTISPECIES: heavy-metal-associated domain-containing protein [unclassified Curtobacterium]|uniref:heavy-metal-associated domain-containing protein n=1 Tax=unclassified Curtobacterium TaxID=257496 RepID=UPI0008DC7CF3|nr:MULTISPECIES: heavy-metal-associated domain-containing protein [unclassified Curtobacterium]OIH97554.1 heavy metal transporter [Curtobacterium sp. MCBA15_003]OII29229.1 heavy metal transporter [Curtobacterium sp. MMLR14_006]
MTTETLLVEGMTCEHCVMSVTEELTELDGVSGVDVRLVVGGSSEVTVTSSAPIDADALDGAVTEAGYQVVRS